MKYEIDIHTHTIASGHAYSTMAEMIAAAKQKGMKGIGITEHAPLMPGSCDEIYFRNLRVVPRDWDGIKVLLGAELNVKDFEGHLDLKENTLQRLDVRIASFHTVVLKRGNKQEIASAVKGTLENPYVDIFGHPDDGRYKYDYEQIAQLAAANDKIIEINNTSLRPNGVRENAYENDLKLLEQCKKCNVPILIGSDAHIAFDVGAHESAEVVVKESGYSEELVLNYHMDELFAILERHKAVWNNQ